MENTQVQLHLNVLSYFPALVKDSSSNTLGHYRPLIIIFIGVNAESACVESLLPQISLYIHHFTGGC